MMRFFIGLVCVLVMAPLSGWAQSPLFKRVMQRVEQGVQQSKRPVVVFDIEGTLMDYRSRNLKIVHDYASMELASTRPEAAKLLLALEAIDLKPVLRDTLVQAGIEEEALINNAHSFWAEKFYTNEYLDFDTPHPGAAAFVQALYAKGAHIIYLSTRDSQRQLVGTVASLQRHGFPLGVRGTELIMRPKSQTPLYAFRRQISDYLRDGGPVVAAFDNDTGNINFLSRAFEKALCVLSGPQVSSKGPALLDGIYRLSDFSVFESSLGAGELAWSGATTQ